MDEIHRRRRKEVQNTLNRKWIHWIAMEYKLTNGVFLQYYLEMVFYAILFGIKLLESSHYNATRKTLMATKCF